jgi:hypothetical protein
VSDQVVIDRRFNGPPDSAHGGYACAMAARFLDWSAAVSLRRPPPLDQPLSVRRDGDGSVTLLDGEAVVAEATPADLRLDVPAPVSLADAEAAAAACPWLDSHVFPTCFGCGPERQVGDGMRAFPGPVAGRDRTWATPWIPDASLAGASGVVDPAFIFAALDCPSCFGAVEPTGPMRMHVLGRLTGQVLAPVEVGDPQVVIAWPIRADGRKRYGGVAIFSDGELRAVGEGLWIEIADPGRFNPKATA